MGYANDHMGNHMFNLQKWIWVTRDLRWIKSSPTLETKMPMETVLTIETVPDEYNDDEGIAPSNHGAPAVANNAPMAATMATVKQGHVHILHKMKWLGG